MCSSLLLRLPLEIRNLIYTCLLRSETAPAAMRDQNVSWNLNRPSQIVGHMDVYTYPNYRFSCLGLLFCNRQINSEMRYFVKHNSSLTSKLDIAIAKERCLYLTWTRLALPSEYVSSLEVDIRFVEEFHNEPRHAGNELGEDRFGGGLGTIWWTFLALLNHYVFCGPNLWGRERIRCKEGIKVLTCNIKKSATSDHFDPNEAVSRSELANYDRAAEREGRLFSEACAMIRMLTNNPKTCGTILKNKVEQAVVLTFGAKETYFDMETMTVKPGSNHTGSV